MEENKAINMVDWIKQNVETIKSTKLMTHAYIIEYTVRTKTEVKMIPNFQKALFPLSLQKEKV